MTSDERKPGYANTDEAAGDFSNDDDNIARQQQEDRADERENQPLPDPAGERHDPDARNTREAEQVIVEVEKD
jgi:hypothetical protein